MTQFFLPLERRLELAQQARAAGYNCAQAVMAAFPDVHALPPEIARRLTTAMGGGLGMTGSTCGALTALNLLTGMLTAGQPSDKADAYRAYAFLHKEFAARNEGRTLCPQLKSAGTPCNTLIEQGVEIFHNALNHDREAEA